MTTKPQAPMVLELAPLPREQVGPFLLLGLAKSAGKEQIEANWAQRIIWARKNQIKVPLEDINWAREALNEPEKRIRADAASLNLDTTDGLLQRLVERYAEPGGSQLLDEEKPLADFTPPIPVPDPDEVRAGVAVPDVPEEVPAVAYLLDRFLKEPLDPWNLEASPSQPPTGGDLDTAQDHRA